MSMSSNSLEPSQMISGNFSGFSISDIIKSLKTSFLDCDFLKAERELLAREKKVREEREKIVGSLRAKCYALEAELEELKTQKHVGEEERRRLKRDCQVNEKNVKDLTRELCVVKDKEEKAIKRYDALLVQLREWETAQKESIPEMANLRDKVEELERILGAKVGKFDELTRKNEAQLEELEVIRRKNESLEEEKAKVNNAHLEEVEKIRRKIEFLEDKNSKIHTHLEQVKGEKDERIRELLKKNEVEKKQIEGLEALLKVQYEELEGIQKKNASLEEEKAELDARCEELGRIDSMKFEKIKELSEKNELLGREKRELMREKDEKIHQLEKEKEVLDMERAKFAGVEDRILKLEEDLLTCMCSDLGREIRYSNTQLGKILSGIEKVLDSEEIGLTCNTQETVSASVSHINVYGGCLKSNKRSEEAVRKPLVFELEISKENRAIGKTETAKDDIIILDSDDDNENPLHFSGAKRKHGCTESLSEQFNLASCNDDSLNPKYKKKKLEHVPDKPGNHYSSTLSATIRDQKFSTPQRQTLATIRRCEEQLRRDISHRRCHGLLDDDGREDERSNYGTYKADKPCSSRLEEFMASCLQRKDNKKLEFHADMVRAFDEEDANFCAKAVCALYRQHKSQISSTKGTMCERHKGFEECDVNRATTLAKFLIDGNSNGEMKKSVDQLQKHDPRSIDDCRRFAKKYSKQLIDIYRKREDPLFSPLSNDLQYK